VTSVWELQRDRASNAKWYGPWDATLAAIKAARGATEEAVEVARDDNSPWGDPFVVAALDGRVGQ
jgi:hypothetical protein